jgi:hypothetical protein
MSPRTGLLGVLVPDETTRRAFEETLADWRDEWQRASSPLERMRVSTRGWISVSRLLAGTMRVGLLASGTWAVFSMALAVSVALSLPLVFWSRTPGPLTLPGFLIAGFLLIPQGMVTLLAPAAAIGLGTRPGREPHVFAVAPALLLTMALLAGWVFPASNQMYREYVFSRVSERQGVLPRGLSELSAADLVREIGGGTPDRSLAAIGQLSTRASLVVAAPVYFIFGVAVRRRLVSRTRWGIARFVAGASAAGVFVVSAYAVSVLRDVSPAIAGLPEARGLSIWLSSVVLCVAIGVLSRGTVGSGRTLDLGRRTPD